MSDHGQGAIQPQIDIGSSLLLTKNAVVSLLQATSQDDVHAQPLLVMEQVGSILLGSLSSKRLEEAIEALSKASYKRFDWLKLSVGLSTGGISRVIRNSTSCIAAFLLITACKTVLTDFEVAQILYDMAEQAQIIRNIPTSTRQIEDVVSAISGYGDQILPTDIYKHTAETIDRQLRSTGHIVPQLFERSSKETIARVFYHVFEALRDQEVVKISLEGHRAAPWLLSVLLWLFPDETECISGGIRLYGNPSARISLQLSIKNSEWSVHEWRAEDKVSSIVIHNQQLSKQSSQVAPLSHMPLKSAHITLGAQFGLTNEESETLGQLAAALIDLSFELGELYSNDLKVAVPLRTLSQAEFASMYHGMIKDFGWDATAYFKEEQEYLLRALRRMIDEGDYSESDSLAHRIAVCLGTTPDIATSRQLISNIQIIAPAVHIAVEALYYCFCDRLPSLRVFRSCTYYRSSRNADILHALLGCTSWKQENARAKLKLETFRIEAFMALLPGSTDVTEADLAVVANGYVAFSSFLEQPGSNPKLCTAISMVPGTLRCETELGGFQRLSEGTDDPYTDSFYDEDDAALLQTFRGSKYLGAEFRVDPAGTTVETLLSPRQKTLQLKSYFKISRKPWRLTVSWKDSMQAVACAEHLNEEDIPPLAEEQLAHALQQMGILQKTVWVLPGGSPKKNSLGRYLTMTSSNEVLRFFEAGRWGIARGNTRIRIFVRQTGPLIQCIKVAADTVRLNDENWSGWVIIG